VIRHILRCGLLATAIALPWGIGASAGSEDSRLLAFTARETARILQHGPWPLPWSRDPGNRVSGKPAAVELGELLFFDKRMSGNGTLACGSCHVPDRDWNDGLAFPAGLQALDRNTPNLMNVRLNRWFGWDGAADSLWAQSIRPLLDTRELGVDPHHVADLVRKDRKLACHYRQVFGAPPSDTDDEAVLVDVAKALAAFQETIVSGPTRFDEFRDALARGDQDAAGRYPQAAQRGLRIFVGKGGCAQCHTGPHFTNGEFHDAGVPFFAGSGRVDAGRHGGIKRLLASPFNLLGRYNDDPSRANAVGTRHVSLEHRNFGEFKVPSLRNAALTGPYMHNGGLATLRDVVRHYSELSVDRLHADGEQILKPLKLSAQETDDLIVFLETLTDYRASWRRVPPRNKSACG